MLLLERFALLSLLLAAFPGFASPLAAAVPDVAVLTEIAPNLLMFETATGNVVVSVGPDGAFLVGTPSAASTPQIDSILASRTKSTARYVVIAPEDSMVSEADAGWGKRGAFVAMHENALRRLGGGAMGAPNAAARRLMDLGVERPRIAFSEVLAFDLNGDAIHVVHQTPGYSNADAIVHFHVGKLVYLGEVFPGDGYPLVDAAQGGNLNGLVKTLSAWTNSAIRIAPAHGKIADGSAVQDFRDMIVTVRERVKHLLDAGQSETQVLAAHPAAEFDARWGHGRVTSEAFVKEICKALKEPPGTM